MNARVTRLIGNRLRLLVNICPEAIVYRRIIFRYSAENRSMLSRNHGCLMYGLYYFHVALLIILFKFVLELLSLWMKR